LKKDFLIESEKNLGKIMDWKIPSGVSDLLTVEWKEGKHVDATLSPEENTMTEFTELHNSAKQRLDEEHRTRREILSSNPILRILFVTMQAHVASTESRIISDTRSHGDSTNAGPP
jgi:hypothetical protein